MEYRSIYCTGCGKKVNARLTSGFEIYNHRQDLHNLIFWKCDTCGNYVGCHKNGSMKTPLGIIPTAEIRGLRKKIHSILDPLWKSGRFKRKELYARISKLVGYEYHTANIRSKEEAEKIIAILSSSKEDNNKAYLKEGKHD